MAASTPDAGPSSARDGPPLATYGRRNVFYLRVSPTVVLPCILYVDGRHLLWLNTHPSVFHSALAYLKTRIMAKLDREAKVIRVNTGRTTDAGNGGPAWGMRGRARHLYKEKRLWGEMSGNEKAETANQPDFNLAYFFKKQNDSHSVLIKDKELIFPKGKNPAPDSADNPSPLAQSAQAVEGGGEYVDPLSSLMNPSQSNADDVQVKRDPEEEEQELLDSLHQPIQPPQDNTDQSDDVTDEKPKFKVKVRYRGFRIFGKSLILVIEPSPAARERSPDLFVSQTPQSKRQLSATPGARSTSVFASTRHASMVDPRPQSLRHGPNDNDQDVRNNRDARDATVTTRRGTSSSASPAPLFFSRGDSMTPSEVDHPSEQPDGTSGQRRRIQPPPTRNHQQGRATARGAAGELPDDDEDQDDTETADDFDAPYETSSEWAQRMQQQSAQNNGAGPTLGDHEGVWAGESRDEFDQIMSNIGASGYGDSADD